MEYVFGYASLSSEAGVLATLYGWQRFWGVAMDNSKDLPGYKHYLESDGTRPGIYVAFLDIQPQQHAEVNGVILPVSQESLTELDLRERNYERVDVTDNLDVVLEGKVWAYRGLVESRNRCQHALREKMLFVQEEYWVNVCKGFRELSADEGSLSVFRQTTLPLPCPLRKLKVVRHDK